MFTLYLQWASATRKKSADDHGKSLVGMKNAHDYIDSGVTFVRSLGSKK